MLINLKITFNTINHDLLLRKRGNIEKKELKNDEAFCHAFLKIHQY